MPQVHTVLPLVDGDCQSGIDALDGLTYSFWDGNDVTFEDFDNSFWSSSQWLSSAAISNTLYGFKEVHTIRDSCASMEQVFKLLRPECIERSEVESQPRYLRLCEKRNYRRLSIEGASLSLAASIEDSYQYYRSLLYPEKQVSLLALLVLPDIRFDRDGDQSLAVTDNAGWVLSNKFPGISVPGFLSAVRIKRCSVLFLGGALDRLP